MGSPQPKRPKLAVQESSTHSAGDISLRVTSEAFGGPSMWDSQHQLWFEREKNRKFRDSLIRTDDGQKIICSKKDLMTLSDYFLAMFSSEEYRESDSCDLHLHNTSGQDFQVLLSLYYSKEKVPISVHLGNRVICPIRGWMLSFYPSRFKFCREKVCLTNRRRRSPQTVDNVLPPRE